MLALALIFTLIATSESKAETCINSSSVQVTCIEKLTDENGNNSCGTNCTFRVVEENGEQVLHIYKENISKPASIRAGAFSPNYYADNQVKDAQNKVIPLQNIVFDNDFEKIGAYAFANSGANISNANGKFVFNDIGVYSTFGKNNQVTLNGDVYLNNPSGTSLERANIKGDVIISENMQTMPDWVLGNSNIDGNVIIPDSVDSIEFFAVYGNITGKIYCAAGAEACYDMVKAGCLSQLEATRRTKCLDKLESLFKANKFSAYPDGCAKLEANLKCTKCKSASFKLEDDGWCLRKIYTPAEAAKVLKDDNNNSVTITFKK